MCASLAEHRRYRKARDYVLYILIGLAVATGTIWVAETGVNPDQFMRWFGLAIFTTILFGAYLVDSRSLFRRRSFWVFTGLLLAIHVGLYSIALARVQSWKVVWFTILTFLELPVLPLLRDYALRRSGPGHGRR